MNITNISILPDPVPSAPPAAITCTPQKYAAVRNADIRRLLYIRLDAIGDAVMAACLLPELRVLYPNAEVIVVCDRACVPVYTDLSCVDDIMALDKNSLWTYDGFRKAQQALAAVDADIVLNFVRSNTEQTFALSLLCGAPLISVANNTSNMSSDARDYLQDFAHTVIPLPDELPEIEIYDHVLDFYGLEHAKCAPYMPVGNEARKKAARIWSQSGFAPDKTIAVFAAAGVPTKDYPLFGAALVPVCKKHGFSVLALGGKGRNREVNRVVADTLIKHGIPALNLSGRLQLAESAALLAACRLAVGVDTSLAHIACALSVPNVILLGGGHFGRFMPYSPKTTVVCLPLECFNCEWRCRYKSPHCITGVKPPMITNAVETALEQGDAGNSGRILMQKPTSIKEAQAMPRRQSTQHVIEQRKDRGQAVTV
jgi:ADP-heptose:LPS heptosyltransferase